MYYVEALDSRDRKIFTDGPFEHESTAKHVADDFAGAEALATFRNQELNVHEHTHLGYNAVTMQGVLSNRALVTGTDADFTTSVVYDTAALDLPV